jgi:hypothetical protein
MATWEDICQAYYPENDIGRNAYPALKLLFQMTSRFHHHTEISRADFTSQKAMIRNTPMTTAIATTEETVPQTHETV